MHGGRPGCWENNKLAQAGQTPIVSPCAGPIIQVKMLYAVELVCALIILHVVLTSRLRQMWDKAGVAMQLRRVDTTLL